MSEEPAKINVKERVQVLFIPMTEAPAKHDLPLSTKFWVRTHGMFALGAYELEVVDVPITSIPVIANFLNGLADYIVNRTQKPLLPGQTYAAEGVFGPGLDVAWRALTSANVAFWGERPCLRMVPYKARMRCACCHCADEKPGEPCN